MQEPLQVAGFAKLDLGIVLLYVVAAIAGAAGGCGAGAVMMMAPKSQIRTMQLFAYSLIGLIAGLLTFGFSHIAGIELNDTFSLIKWCAMVGLGVPVALFSKNLAISAVLRRFGWEVQFTMRRSGENRRRDGD